MATFRWDPEYVRWDLDGAAGWAYYNWARQNRASVWGVEEKTTSAGYLRQEIDRILKEHG